MNKEFIKWQNYGRCDIVVLQNGNLTYHQAIDYPTDAVLFGQVTFLDIGSNRGKSHQLFCVILIKHLF